MPPSSDNKENRYQTIRFYGPRPYKVAVLHGGPGAPGYMAPVARRLSADIGVLEPLQTASSLEGQIEELKDQLVLNAEPPIALIGSSWGAVLALFTAARKEIAIEKLILIGSAVFDAENSARIEGIRLSRLDDAKRRRFEEIKAALSDPDIKNEAETAREWGDIFFHTDVYDPMTTTMEVMEVQYEINEKVWPEFTVLRDKPGYLKNKFSEIDVPTVVIHGDYDPHPIEGIRPFLESCIKDIRFYILTNCGHYPWMERYAERQFYKILRKEIINQLPPAY
jgi:pimeloyl-ACP methyl ester carboxylesterase